jgi:hypothetical protein
MGLMTELFVAERGQAKTYTPASPGDIERAQLGGLTSLEFETLWAILQGEEWTLEKHALREVVSREESWIHEFPGSYVEKLRTLGGSEMASAAAQWAATEEISSTADEVLPIIEQLVSLARSAAAKRKTLFVWVAL